MQVEKVYVFVWSEGYWRTKKKVSEYWLLNFEAYLILLERMNYRRVKLQIHAGMLVVARSHC